MNTQDLTVVTESEKAMLEQLQYKRFLDLERVPLICNDIAEIRRMLEAQKNTLVTQDQFWPVKTLVYGLVGLLLTGVIGGIIISILK